MKLIRSINTRLMLLLDRMLSGSIFSWQHILRLQVPLILDTMSITVCNVLIMLLISENGPESVAAVSLVSPISGLIACLFAALSSGSTVVVAQSLGLNNQVFLKKSIGMSMWITTAVGVVLCLPVILFPEGLLHLVYPSIEPAVMEKACVFLAGSALSNISFTVYLAVFSILRGLGEASKCMVLSIIINVAYLLFSILFLNVMDLDILGSVYALNLARLAGALSALVAMFLWKPSVRLRLRDIFSFDWRLFRSNLQISVPLALEQIFANLGSVVSQMYMVSLGTKVLAVNTIISSVLGFIYSPAASTSNLSVTVVGHCIGAKKFDEAYRYGKRSCQISRVLMIIACLIMFPIMPMFLKQYHLTPEAEHVVFVILLSNLPFLLTVWPISTVMQATLQSAGDAVFTSAVSLVGLWVMTIALGYVMAIPCGLGLWGVWIGNWACWVFRAAIFTWRYRKKKWMYKSSLAKL